MRGIKAGVLALILGGHAALYFWHWYLPVKTSPLATPTETTPVSVTIAVAQPKPVAKASPSPRSMGRALTKPSEASPIARSEDASTIAADAPVTDLTPVAPLQLTPPSDSRIAAIGNSPARMALEDPRSNTARPRQSERFAIALGSYECVATERMPDGSIYRGPGVWDEVPNSDVTATGKILDPRGPAKVCRRKSI